MYLTSYNILMLGNGFVVKDRMVEVERTAILCTTYLERAWELNDYLGKLYCVSVL